MLIRVKHFISNLAQYLVDSFLGIDESTESYGKYGQYRATLTVTYLDGEKERWEDYCSVESSVIPEWKVSIDKEFFIKEKNRWVSKGLISNVVFKFY